MGIEPAFLDMTKLTRWIDTTIGLEHMSSPCVSFFRRATGRLDLTPLPARAQLLKKLNIVATDVSWIDRRIDLWRSERRWNLRQLRCSFFMSRPSRETVARERPSDKRFRDWATKSDRIRALAAQGMKPAEIAKELGIRYQRAYNVINGGADRYRGPSVELVADGAIANPVQKPVLTAELLISGGFRQVSRWALSGGNLVLESPVPKEV
ncbi:hypothetical protein [Brucella anthropi]|uniref:hypothetical protein n=1 Tax=Brucella anthropi TaxID=529 RepID=UPI001F3731E0|nr:hypothetical protein [Brucella anthropi]